MKIRGDWGRTAGPLFVCTLIGGAILLAVAGGPGGLLTSPGTTLGTIQQTTAGKLPKNLSRVEAYGKLPLSFEENQGQTAQQVRYIAHGPGYELFLAPQEAVISLKRSMAWNLSALHRAEYFRALRQGRQARTTTTVVRMGLEGASFQARISGLDPLPGKVNYFIGNQPARWQLGVPTYARVKYTQLYPGVDLMFYGNQGRLEYDFLVAPGADPKAIVLTLEGARRLQITPAGDLILHLAAGQLLFQKPVFYQITNGERKQIEGRYALAGKHRVTFAVSRYDRTAPLVIDPVLNYSTYLGGSATGDVGSSIAVDSNGDAFVAGTTFSTTFPTQNGFGAGNANGVAFVTELNPAGTALLYSTYLGGTGGDNGLGIALDASGNVYLVGLTFSSDFPTTPLPSPTCSASIAALKPGPNTGATSGTSFISKINPAVNGACSLVYSSYLGGVSGAALPDFANAVAANASGNAYITGYTASPPGSALGDFPITANAFRTALGSTDGNAFLTQIDTTKSGTQSLIFSSYLGGSGAFATSSGLDFGEDGLGIALDSSNNAYIMGTTTSSDFPTTSTAFQPNTAPPAADAMGTAFISRIDTTVALTATTSPLIYSTYLGGDVSEFGTAIAVKPNSAIAYVTGTSSSPGFPTFPANTFQNAAATVLPAAFVTLLDTSQPAATALVYSTFLGGNTTTGFGIQADSSGNAYVAGGTTQPAFPVTEGAFQQSFATGASGEGFLSKFSPGGNGTADLTYSTLFGGSGNSTISGGEDSVHAIAIDSSNNAYITGPTFSAAFPIFPPASASPPAFQTSLPSGATSAAFVAKLTPIPTLAVSPTSLSFGVQPDGVTSAAQTVALTNNTSGAIPFAAGNLTFSGTNAADFASPSNTCGASIAAGASCTVSVTFTPSTTAAESATLVITVMISDGGVTASQTFNVALSGTGSASAPGASLAPTSLNFGNQPQTTTSAPMTVTLTNTGNAALTITNIVASGDFAETNTCPISPSTLPATAGSNTCTISVTFTPTVSGTRNGTLSVSDNAGGSPQTVALTGNGTAAPNFGLTGPSAVQDVKDGQTLMFSVTMTPTGGFNSAVMLACTGAPMLATCTVSPSSVTASDGVTPQQAQVSLMTKGMIIPPTRVPTPPGAWRVIPPLLALLVVALLARTRRMYTRLGMLTAVILLTLLAGCSNGPTTPKGPAVLTITGSSGSLSHSVQVNILVQ
jgi:hypothetical protein